MVLYIIFITILIIIIIVYSADEQLATLVNNKYDNNYDEWMKQSIRPNMDSTDETLDTILLGHDDAFIHISKILWQLEHFSLTTYGCEV